MLVNIYLEEVKMKKIIDFVNFARAYLKLTKNQKIYIRETIALLKNKK